MIAARLRGSDLECHSASDSLCSVNAYSSSACIQLQAHICTNGCSCAKLTMMLRHWLKCYAQALHEMLLNCTFLTCFDTWPRGVKFMAHIYIYMFIVRHWDLTLSVTFVLEKPCGWVTETNYKKKKSNNVWSSLSCVRPHSQLAWLDTPARVSEIWSYASTGGLSR